MKKKGGYRENSGRKPKADEITLIEQLSPYDEIARTKLIAGVKRGNIAFIKLFYEYRYGKPKQMIDLQTTDTRTISDKTVFCLKPIG